MVNQADDNGKIIRFVPMDHGQTVTGFTGARLYYPPRSDSQYGDYVTGVESDCAWDFTIPTGVLNAGRVECNLAFIDGNGETYSRNVVFLVEPAETFNENPTAYTGGTMPLPRAAEKYLEDRN